MKKYNRQYLFFIYVILFMIFLSFFPRNSIIGIERIVATYTLGLLITYAVTQDWSKSVFVALGFTFLGVFLDSNGLFSDYKYQKNKEYFKIEPAGEGVEDVSSFSEAKTTNHDETNFEDEDLDSILNKDEKDNKSENEHLEKAGGGLDKLKDLLDMAKKDSPYSDDKDTKNYTPAEAQRETYHLIDTVKQLKETMNDMMPLMKAGGNLIDLYKKMGGSIKAPKN